jgi:hypothetical protein
MQFGNLTAAYDALQPGNREKQVVFRPGLTQRTSAAALQAISSMTMALDGQLADTGKAPPAALKESSVGCTFPYITYCESVASAVRYVLSQGKGVVVSSQPRAIGEGRSHELHIKQQEMLGAMVARVFGNEPRVAWADFSELVDLHSTDVTFDSMHLKPEANATVAAALVEPVIRALSLTETK